MNDVRREFVTKALLREASMAALCRQYGISRKTGHKWRQRALDDGLNVLAEHSRRPHCSPKQLPEAVTCALIRLKLRHPKWGPAKICNLHRREQGSSPSPSSCHRVLRQAGLIEIRRRRVGPVVGRMTQGLVAKACNEVWTVDFKGWWRVGNGERCEPLTVRDAFSRFLLTAKTLAAARTPQVQAEFTRLFELYGVPDAIKSDNGSPFASRSAAMGLSRLSAWWVSLGIELDRSRPAHPQDNGAHERMHRDLQAEIAQHVQPNLTSQQAALELWREEFNWKRPHAALGGKCPGEVYEKSKVSFASRSAPLDYGPGFFPRKVSLHGILKWQNRAIFISNALTGFTVGIRQLPADELEVWFAFLCLGKIELKTNSFLGSPSLPKEAVRLSA